jgi:predicted amino acid-binding ACT domain protein
MADKRGELINVGGTILKALFGVATLVDLGDLHTTVDVLQGKEGAIVHSLNQQVKYLKQQAGSGRFNYQAVATLSATLKEIVTKVQEDFQEVASKVSRNSKHIEAAAVIRQLEFALPELELSIDEIMNALQYVQLGKILLNLISPIRSREMLKNVTLVLHDGYHLVAGLRLNVYLCYEVIQAIMLADVQF